MKNKILQLFVCVGVFSVAAQGQTLSQCRASPPLPANMKPGVNGLSLSRDGKTLVVAGGDAKIRLVDITSGATRQTLTGHTNAVYRAIFSPDEKLLASSSRDQTVRVWSTNTGSELMQFDGFRCSVKTVAFSRDGKLLAAAGNDGVVKVYELKTQKELRSLIHLNSADIDMSIYSVTFNRDGRKLYAANGDGSISEWDVTSGKESRTWKAHDHYVLKLAFNPDYTLLASLADSGVKLWDTATWREVRELSMSRNLNAVVTPSELTFSIDGKLVAASNIGIDRKGSAYLWVQEIVWQVKSGEKLFTFDGHRFDVNGLVFSKDRLLTGGVDATINFWDLKTGSNVRSLHF